MLNPISKNKLSRIYFSGLIILSIGCHKPTPKDLSCNSTSIQVVENLLNSGAQFSDIFIAVDTVCFETSKNSIIGAIYQVLKHPYGYIVLDRTITKEVLFFDHNGKFIKKLGAKGEGPTEFKSPEYIYLDKKGSTYILDPTLRKILKYDIQCQFIEELSFKDLGLHPSEFVIAGENSQLYVFYNIDGDFYGKSKKKKIVLTQNHNNRFTFQDAFGTSEPLLSKLFFNMGTFHLTPTNEIWLSEIFGLNVEIYSLDGRKLKTITTLNDILPKPHISPKALEKFDRISKSLETFYSLTRLYKHIFLDDCVVGIYFKNPETYFVFLDYCGNVVSKILTVRDKYPLPSIVVGSWDNKFYCFSEREIEATTSEIVSNPMLVGYAIRNNSKDPHN